MALVRMLCALLNRPGRTAICVVETVCGDRHCSYIKDGTGNISCLIPRLQRVLAIVLYSHVFSSGICLTMAFALLRRKGAEPQ